MGVHIGTTWRMWLNRPCAAAIQPYVKLLWPLVIFQIQELLPWQWFALWVSSHSGFYWSKRWWGSSGISWTICKSFAPRFRQITMPVHHHSFFTGGTPFPSPNQQCQSTEGNHFHLENNPKTEVSIHCLWCWLDMCSIVYVYRNMLCFVCFQGL